MNRRKDRERLKKEVEKVLKEEGPLLQSQLAKKIDDPEETDYLNPYKNKQSLAVTLSQVREKWEETGFISTEEEVPERGSLITHKWRLK